MIMFEVIYLEHGEQRNEAYMSSLADAQKLIRLSAECYCDGDRKWMMENPEGRGDTLTYSVPQKDAAYKIRPVTQGWIR